MTKFVVRGGRTDRQEAFDEAKPHLLKILEDAVLKAAERCPEGFRSWLGMTGTFQPEQDKEHIKCPEQKSQASSSRPARRTEETLLPDMPERNGCNLGACRGAAHDAVSRT